MPETDRFTDCLLRLPLFYELNEDLVINQLNKTFYYELLHIIGLEEVKDKGKKVINRKGENNRDYASLLENAIVILEDRDYLSTPVDVRILTPKLKTNVYVGMFLCTILRLEKYRFNYNHTKLGSVYRDLEFSGFR